MNYVLVPNQHASSRGSPSTSLLHHLRPGSKSWSSFFRPWSLDRACKAFVIVWFAAFFALDRWSKSYIIAHDSAHYNVSVRGRRSIVYGVKSRSWSRLQTVQRAGTRWPPCCLAWNKKNSLKWKNRPYKFDIGVYTSKHPEVRNHQLHRGLLAHECSTVPAAAVGSILRQLLLAANLNQLDKKKFNHWYIQQTNEC